eukprot:1141803-Pelagomonas_calceolata.AAC.8
MKQYTGTGRHIFWIPVMPTFQVLSKTLLAGVKKRQVARRRDTDARDIPHKLHSRPRKAFDHACL